MTLIATENIKHILISILINIKTHIKCCKFLLANISCIYFNNKKIAWHAKRPENIQSDGANMYQDNIRYGRNFIIRWNLKYL